MGLGGGGEVALGKVVIPAAVGYWVADTPLCRVSGENVPITSLVGNMTRFASLPPSCSLWCLEGVKRKL